MDSESINITILLFENFTALDVIGPYEVLAKLPNSKIIFAGKEKTEYKDSKGLCLKSSSSINAINETDVLLIPGGFGIDALLTDKALINWVERIHQTTTWTTSVCSGSILLAEAGILNGKKCTTHWQRKEQLKKYNVFIEDKRYIRDGKIITSAGISAGIDMALYLAAKLTNENTAKIIQLALEYDPQPPFDCGSPDKAPKEFVQLLKR